MSSWPLRRRLILMRVWHWFKDAMAHYSGEFFVPRLYSTLVLALALALGQEGYSIPMMEIPVKTSFNIMFIAFNYTAIVQYNAFSCTNRRVWRETTSERKRDGWKTLGSGGVWMYIGYNPFKENNAIYRDNWLYVFSLLKRNCLCGFCCCCCCCCCYYYNSSYCEEYVRE